MNYSSSAISSGPGLEGYGVGGPVDQTRLNKCVKKLQAKEFLASGLIALKNGDARLSSRFFQKSIDCADDAIRYGSAKEAIEIKKVASDNLSLVKKES